MIGHKAIIQNKAAGPLSISRIGTHEIANNQLLVKIQAVALNVGLHSPFLNRNFN